MSTVDTESELLYEDDLIDETDDEFVPYRAISKAAVLSLVFAVLSLLALLFPTLLVLPAIGLIFGFVAHRNLKKYPEELTGRVTALLGTAGCFLLLVGGSAMHTYIYFTEVPEGYTRITYADLQPTETLPGTNIPKLPEQLDGKRIFIKGYVHPGVASMGRIRKFILVPDMGTCCFGGQPKRLTDMIEVTLVNSKGIRYSTRKRKLGGIFHVHYSLHEVAGGLKGGFYELTADYVK